MLLKGSLFCSKRLFNILTPYRYQMEPSICYEKVTFEFYRLINNKPVFRSHGVHIHFFL